MLFPNSLLCRLSCFITFPVSCPILLCMFSYISFPYFFVSHTEAEPLKSSTTSPKTNTTQTNPSSTKSKKTRNPKYPIWSTVQYRYQKLNRSLQHRHMIWSRSTYHNSNSSLKPQHASPPYRRTGYNPIHLLLQAIHQAVEGSTGCNDTQLDWSMIRSRHGRVFSHSITLSLVMSHLSKARQLN